MGLPYESVVSGSSAEPDSSLVRVEQIPGMKGAFLKHVEYNIITQRSQACRRYNDFVLLHDCLLQLYPTRLIPRLPPKKSIGADDNFLAHRQKGLERYATILGKHPVIGNSGVFQHFLTHTGKDLQGTLRERFKSDEFSSVHPATYEHIRTQDWTARLVQVKEQMANAELSLQKLRDIFEAMNACTKDQLKNHMALNAELSNLCTLNTSPFVEFASGATVARQPFTGILGDVASEIAGVSKQWLELANTEEAIIADYLHMIRDLMKGWKDFFVRQTKYTAEEQKTLAKAMNTSQKSKEGENSQEKTAMAMTADNRTKFSFHCLEQELSFIEGLLVPLMAKFLQAIASSEKRHHGKISTAWQDVEDIAGLLPLSCETVRPQPSAPVS